MTLMLFYHISFFEFYLAFQIYLNCCNFVYPALTELREYLQIYSQITFYSNFLILMVNICIFPILFFILVYSINYKISKKYIKVNFKFVNYTMYWKNVYRVDSGSGFAFFSIYIDLFLSTPNLFLIAWHGFTSTIIFSRVSFWIVKYTDIFTIFIYYST